MKTHKFIITVVSDSAYRDVKAAIHYRVMAENILRNSDGDCIGLIESKLGEFKMVCAAARASGKVVTIR